MVLVTKCNVPDPMLGVHRIVLGQLQAQLIKLFLTSLRVCLKNGRECYKTLGLVMLSNGRTDRLSWIS
jgi:hypothetical protein